MYLLWTHSHLQGTADFLYASFVFYHSIVLVLLSLVLALYFQLVLFFPFPFQFYTPPFFSGFSNLIFSTCFFFSHSSFSILRAYFFIYFFFPFTALYLFFVIPPFTALNLFFFFFFPLLSALNLFLFFFSFFFFPPSNTLNLFFFFFFNLPPKSLQHCQAEATSPSLEQVYPEQCQEFFSKNFQSSFPIKRHLTYTSVNTTYINAPIKLPQLTGKASSATYKKGNTKLA
jgi:hypothetical protein